MPQAKQPPKQRPAVPKERAKFTALLAQNHNYFGNLALKAPKAVKKIVTNTTYEELTCVGFHPPTNALEATIALKRPTGYSGDLCSDGSTEYVRFYLDYGAGWEDAGLTGIRVHDIPDGKDCAGDPDKPLTYVANLEIDPKRRCCTHAVLPRVRAILSWQWTPPAADPGWSPVWGNVLECDIQIAPRPWDIGCLLEEIKEQVGDFKLPELIDSQDPQPPIPLPDPPPLTLAQLAETYAAPKQAKKAQKAFAVDAHRFGQQELHALSAQATGFDSAALIEAEAVWAGNGLDLAGALAAYEDTTADVSYEELECLGLDERLPERLVATFRIKRPNGYSGNLCQAGSHEYVAFWAQLEDADCQWIYLGTAGVNVHDIAEIPAEGLCYSAILPVDFSKHRRPCDKPALIRVRAVLSWGVPPSTKDPDDLTTWGNRIDTHVQLAPGDPVGDPDARLRILGGIAVEEIDTAGGGLTLPGAIFAHNPAFKADSADRACPFGGVINVEGHFLPGHHYRVKVRRQTDPPGSETTIGGSVLLLRSDYSGYDTNASSGGWFQYRNPALYDSLMLAHWVTGAGDDGLWVLTFEVATAPNDASIIDTTAYRIEVDNTAPSADIHITTGGGDCADFDEGTVINGTFFTDDAHFGSWKLGTEPNTATTPSNPPTATPALAPTTPAPAGHGWSVDTAPPPPGLVTMKPCGYVVRLVVSDRAIVHSSVGLHNNNATSVGLCLRDV